MFPNQTALNSAPVLTAMANSLKTRGHHLAPDQLDADAVILWSALWDGKMKGNERIYYHYRGLGRPVIFVDIGTLSRGRTWKVAVNNITAAGYYGHTQNLDWDRPSQLGIKLDTGRSKRPHVLIAAQHGRSLQVAQQGRQEDWIQSQIDTVLANTDRPIVVRPHPRSSLTLKIANPRVQLQAPRRVPDTYDDYDLGFDCHAVISYNSGPGIQAALAGTPVVVDPTSLAYPVSIPIDQIQQPPEIDRQQWLVEICHTEYTVPELEQGLWLDRIQEAV